MLTILSNLDPLSIFITGAAALIGLVSILTPKSKRPVMMEDFYSTVTLAEWRKREESAPVPRYEPEVKP